MFNMNPRVSDSPLDAPRDFKEYCRQAQVLLRITLKLWEVKLKFRSVACAAVEMGAEAAVP